MGCIATVISSPGSVSAIATLIAGALLQPLFPHILVHDRSVPSSFVQVQAPRTWRYGPYATLRRANEVANEFRRLGYQARVYLQWGDYFVDVWQEVSQ